MSKWNPVTFFCGAMLGMVLTFVFNWLLALPALSVSVKPNALLDVPATLKAERVLLQKPGGKGKIILEAYDNSAHMFIGAEGGRYSIALSAGDYAAIRIYDWDCGGRDIGIEASDGWLWLSRYTDAGYQRTRLVEFDAPKKGK